MATTNVFISYNFKDQHFVTRVHRYLSKQPDLQCYLYAEDHRLDGWRSLITDELKSSARLLLFLGPRLGNTQKKEAAWFSDECGAHLDKRAIKVCLSLDGKRTARQLIEYVECKNIVVEHSHDAWQEEDARKCAQEIALSLTQRWVPHDGLPTGYPFAYEKDIIQAYRSASHDEHDTRRIQDGCPEEWPDVERVQRDDAVRYDNAIREEVIGKFRKDGDRILVDARIYRDHSETLRGGLSFPEAGPREHLCFPHKGNLLTVGILVSGGIAPGINAVISGIVERHTLYAAPPAKALRNPALERRTYTLQILGFRDGFDGLLERNSVVSLYGGKNEFVRGIANEAGSKIGTSRRDGLLSSGDLSVRDAYLTKVVNNLHANYIDIIYVIGGDGSMKAAHAIWTKACEMREANPALREISVVGVPKTMDNDILWVWQSFGFLSAVQRANEAIRQLYTEVRSNPRLCVVQLFGSDSGFVVSHAALASGVCDAALIPEVSFSMRRLADYIRDRLKERFRPGFESESPYGLVVMAETAIPQDVEEYIDDKRIGLDAEEKKGIRRFLADGRRVHGQTPDALRTGSLKIVSRVLQIEIQKMKEDDPYWETFRVFANEPRHLLRAIAPSSADVIFAQRLGVLAVDNVMAGYTDFMISQWLTEYVLVPLKLVVLGRKRVPPQGIFWKSLLANTGQPESLSESAAAASIPRGDATGEEKRALEEAGSPNGSGSQDGRRKKKTKRT